MAARARARPRDRCASASRRTPRTRSGDIVFVQLPEVGETVTSGAVVGELESTKSVSEVYAPARWRGRRPQRGPRRDAGAGQHRPVRRRLALRDRARQQRLGRPAGRRHLRGRPRGLTLRSGSSVRLSSADRLTRQNPDPPLAVQGLHPRRREIHDMPYLLAVREPELRQRAVLLAMWHPAGPSDRAGHRAGSRRRHRHDHLRRPAEDRGRRAHLAQRGRRGRGRRASLRAAHCWSSSAGPEPAAATSSTPTSPRSAVIPRATSSSTTSPSPGGTSSSGARARASASTTSAASTAPTSTATGSTTRSCRTATRSGSASSG